jgi:hypothetical protein
MTKNRIARVLTDAEIDGVSAGCNLFGQSVSALASSQPRPGAFGEFVAANVAQNPGLIATVVHASQQLC